MTRSLLLPLLCLLALLSGCVKNEFHLEFSLPPAVSESYPMLYYASDPEKGWLVDQVAVVTGGKGDMKCITRNPTLVYVFQGGMDPGLVIYAERGDRIRIMGDNPSPGTWRVEGNKVNESLTEWRMENREALSQRDSKSINAAVVRFVRNNPSDPVSTLLLLIYYDRGSDSKGFDSTYKLLKGNALDPEWTDLVSRNDLVGGYAPGAFKTGPLVFRTAGSGCDTIRFDSVPALLLFANNNYGSRRADILSLKRFLKERADSAHALVVDVNMEPDSSAWRYQLRNDSLDGAVRAWVPLAFSDTASKALGIRGIPTFVVVRKGGDVLYRGASADSAVAMMRSLLKK